MTQVVKNSTTKMIGTAIRFLATCEADLAMYMRCHR